MEIKVFKPTKLLKSKYTRRTGGPGNYKYEYGEKKGKPVAKRAFSRVMRPKDKNKLRHLLNRLQRELLIIMSVLSNLMTMKSL